MSTRSDRKPGWIQDLWDWVDESIHLNETDVMFNVFSSSLLPPPPLRELKGVVTSLSSDGHLLCSYMGTDPSFFSTPKVDAREADYEQVEAEMKKLQKLIREATRTQGGITAPRSVSTQRRSGTFCSHSRPPAQVAPRRGPGCDGGCVLQHGRALGKHMTSSLTSPPHSCCCCTNT